MSGAKAWELLVASTPVQKVAIEGEVIAYRDFHADASGPVLLALHGNICDGRHFALLAARPEFQNLRVVALDMRGFGQSTANHRVASHSDWARDTAAVIQALKLDKPIVIGHSTGGGVALTLACEFPDVARAIILKDAVSPDGYRLALPGKETLTSEDVIGFVAMAFAPLYSKDVDEQHNAWATIGFLPGTAPSKDSAEFIQLLSEPAHAQAEHCRGDAMWANVAFNVTPFPSPVSPASDALKKIKAPVYVLHGEQDVVIPYAQVDACVKRIQDEQLSASPWKMCPHPSGHIPLLEDPDAFAPVLAKILDEIRA